MDGRSPATPTHLPAGGVEEDRQHGGEGREEVGGHRATHQGHAGAGAYVHGVCFNVWSPSCTNAPVGTCDPPPHPTPPNNQPTTLPNDLHQVSRFKNPWEELAFQYAGQQGKERAYSSEEDRYLLCFTNHYGYGNWEVRVGIMCVYGKEGGDGRGWGVKLVDDWTLTTTHPNPEFKTNKKNTKGRAHGHPAVRPLPLRLLPALLLRREPRYVRVLGCLVG